MKIGTSDARGVNFVSAPPSDVMQATQSTGAHIDPFMGRFEPKQAEATPTFLSAGFVNIYNRNNAGKSSPPRPNISTASVGERTRARAVAEERPQRRRAPGNCFIDAAHIAADPRGLERRTAGTTQQQRRPPSLSAGT